MEKLERGASDVVTDKNSNLTLVRWKDNKVVTVVSKFVGKMALRKAHRKFMSKIKLAGLRLTSLNIIYNKGMGGVDRLDQNISCYMIRHRSKKWYWPVFRVFWIYQ